VNKGTSGGRRTGRPPKSIVPVKSNQFKRIGGRKISQERRPRQSGEMHITRKHISAMISTRKVSENLKRENLNPSSSLEVTERRHKNPLSGGSGGEKRSLRNANGQEAILFC